jgi:hypothetical protein
MQTRLLAAVGTLGVLLPASTLWAQTTAPSAPPIYRSAFADYRAWRDEAPQDWRASNREMEKLGGHVGHLRGHLPDAPPPEQGAPAPAANDAVRMPHDQMPAEKKR